MCFCARVRVNSILVAACTRRESRVLRFNEAAVIDDEWVGKRTRNVGRCLYSILIDFFAPDAACDEFRSVGIIIIRSCVSSERAISSVLFFFFFHFESEMCSNFVQIFGRVIIEISHFEV